jgi:hypothetical protein
MKLRADLGNGQSESLESFAVGYRFLTLPRPLGIDYGDDYGDDDRTGAGGNEGSCSEQIRRALRPWLELNGVIKKVDRKRSGLRKRP